MKSSPRIVVSLVAGLVCLSALGVFSSTAGALTEAQANAAQTRENIHTLQVAIQSYAVDNGDVYPPFVSNWQFRTLLGFYIDSWPINPYTDHRMRQKRNAGNFRYVTHDDGTSFRLIGWGRHHRRIIVVP